jgi:hypothetical protein
MGREVYVVEIEDASQPKPARLTWVGGPMGSEYTTPAGTEVFESEENARAWVEKKTKRGIHPRQWQTVTRNLKPIGISFDAGAYIYTIKRQSVQ